MAGVIVYNLGYKIKQLANVDYSNFSYKLNSNLFEIFITHGFEWMGLIPFVLWFLTTMKLSDFDLNLKGLQNLNVQKMNTGKQVSRAKKSKKTKR